MSTEPPRLALVRTVRDELADLAPDGLVLVACSGGPDSVALAAAARAAHARVGAVVVDHGLQAGSDGVASRVGSWLRESGLDPVEVVAVDVIADGEGLEAAARSARYAALTDAAQRHSAVAVLLGHTLDDQAETVLLGLARGSGTRSLAGMPRRRGLLRRPLLDLRRDLVRAAVPDGAPIVEDPHNVDPRFSRARVRAIVLPVLEAELGPGIAEALARTAALARADDEVLAAAADEARTAAVTPEGELVVAALEGLSPAVRGRVLRSWLVAHGAPAGALGAEHVERVARLVTAWRGQGAVALPGGVEVGRMRGMLCVRPTPPRKET